MALSVYITHINRTLLSLQPHRVYFYRHILCMYLNNFNKTTDDLV